MQISRRSLIQGSALLAGSSLVPLPAWAQDKCPIRPVYTPASALAKLREGNGNFDGGKLVPYPIDKRTLRCQADNKQTPFATIVSCSDSRAGPEQIFQVGIGELFVVRNAGTTVANPQALGSIEYSVAELHVPLIVVLGHTHCGAVKEATNIVRDNKHFPPTLEAMLLPIVPSALAVRGQPGDPVENAIHENVRRVAAGLRSPDQPILFPPQRTGELKVVGAVYDLASGTVDWFDMPAMTKPAH